MNNDIEFLNVEWRTRYSLLNFEDYFDCMPQLFLDPIMCAIWYISVSVSSQTPVVNWQN